ncbi:MAG: valine--tRNA ligase [Hyphomicrobiales bacterium]|nr:valine--tRNA ligase [Hyphomicrobiales bacterium]
MLPKNFEASDIEARISRAWEDANCFAAGPKDRVGKAAPYCTMLPPPNVTGSLHMGHALNHTLQDILVRFERMRGRDVLWQPGTDHAGIATQMVVERQLMERQLPGRREMGREAFLKRVWEWKAESGGAIVEQQKRLGESCDWSRQRFTMDEGLSKAVTKVFVELYNQGLIYKDKRLVNWDPKLLTAISDLEVISVEKRGSFAWSRDDKAEDGTPKPLDTAAFNKVIDRDPHGHLYYFRYPIKNPGRLKNKFITVATTRPETILGDTAVAVNPNDKRWKAYVGKIVILPITGREIPVIADDYADPEQGTGAVKITPAHDENDFKVGRRHNLKLVNILTGTAVILIRRIGMTNPDLDDLSEENLEILDKFDSLDRFEARKLIVQYLEAEGLLDRIEPHTHKVPHGDRSGAAIEPWLMDQWYVDAKELAKPAIAAVEDGRTRFIPENWEKTYFQWMRNIEPWCISRQLWWGHQIPAWYGPKLDENGQVKKLLVESFAASASVNDFQIFACENEAAALDEATKLYGETPTIADSPFNAALGQLDTRKVHIWRDPDVLDTWFSSALWPFSTLGWPDKTPELDRYYPGAVLVTGFDIIFFWVARMMMMGLHFMKEVPFDTVYIHALVRDEKGQKMSKSKGNVMDPLGLIDEYGADALRFTMAAMAAQGRDVKMSTQRVEGYRNFATKLWNASRFAEINGCIGDPKFDPLNAKLAVNRWIAGETEAAAHAIATALEAYKFNEAAGAAYQFVWNTFCDWYVELVKPVLTGPDCAAKAETQAMTAWTLEQIVKLLHPFMPFITEELWDKQAELAGGRRDSMLALAEWPQLSGLANEKAAAEINWVIAATSEIRSALAEFTLPAGTKVQAAFIASDAKAKSRVETWKAEIARIARLKGVEIGNAVPKGSVQIVLDGAIAALPIGEFIDVQAEIERIRKQAAQAQAEIAKVDAKLGNADFVAKAPEAVVEENRERRAANEAIIAKLAEALKRIEAAV